MILVFSVSVVPYFYLSLDILSELSLTKSGMLRFSLCGLIYTFPRHNQADVNVQICLLHNCSLLCDVWFSFHFEVILNQWWVTNQEGGGASDRVHGKLPPTLSYTPDSRYLLLIPYQLTNNSKLSENDHFTSLKTFKPLSVNVIPDFIFVAEN